MSLRPSPPSPSQPIRFDLNRFHKNTSIRLEKDYKYINRESDLGIPGLRTAKERLHPDHMMEVYCIEKQDL